MAYREQQQQSQSQELKMMLNSKQKQIITKQTYAQPLIVVQEANLAIYPDRIILYTKKKDNSISAVDTTILSVNDNEASDKAILFKNDLAFKIDEKKRKISIVTINNEKTQLEFIVEKVSQLIIVQQILRRKLCQIGFEEKFKIIKQLGKGATAKVYLVQRISDQRLFAAKIISIKQASNKDYDTFTNETKIIKSLKNPHILAIQSLYISKKELICVIEYLEGGTLLEELKNDVIRTDKQKFKAISDIADGLEHLRQKRISHRDLKLQNIMVRINKDKTKDYVIVDFGLACWIGEKDLLYEKCGTPGYIAPQILRAPKGKIIVSHNSDVFSFGVICHFIMLLKAVFPYNGNAKELLQLNKKAIFSLQTKHHFSLMSSEFQILKKTLQIDPAKRISSDELVKVYIKVYQKEVTLEQNRKKKIVASLKDKQQKKQTSVKRNRIQLSNSIQMIEKRVPSMEKQQFSNRMKTQQAKSVKKQQRENSVGKFFGKVWNKISRSNTEVLKKKQQTFQRKKQMKDFIV